MISRRLGSSDLFVSSWEVCRDTRPPGVPLDSSLPTPVLAAREECAARTACPQEPMHPCSVPTLPNHHPAGYWCPCSWLSGQLREWIEIPWGLLRVWTRNLQSCFGFGEHGPCRNTSRRQVRGLSRIGGAEDDSSVWTTLWKTVIFTALSVSRKCCLNLTTSDLPPREVGYFPFGIKRKSTSVVWRAENDVFYQHQNLSQGLLPHHNK